MKPTFPKGLSVQSSLFRCLIASLVLLQVVEVKAEIPEAFSESDGNRLLLVKWGASGDVPLPGDYDGDGKADPACFRPADSTWRILGSGGTSWTNVWGEIGDTPVPGDYDGDGRKDFATFRHDGTWSVLGSSGDAWTNVWGTSGDVPAPADYDGDGKWDYAFFRPSEGKWHIRSFTGNKWTSLWGASGDLPIPNDFDGDGKADAALFRPADGAWYIAVHGFTRWMIPFGGAEDFPISSDFNGDGRADVAFWKSSTAVFHISHTQGEKQSISWGEPGDLPITADFDGDGTSDVAVFRPDDGTWHIRREPGDRGSQEPLRYSSRRWQTDDGLPHSFVNSIVPARNGPLWLATSGGLVHFDGVSFASFDSPLLNRRSIRLLYQTKDGAVWIAPEREGLLRLKNGIATEETIASHRQVRAFLQARDGSFWIGTSSGVGRRKEGTWEWLTKEDGLHDDVVLALCEDGAGTVWIGTGMGLVSYKAGKLHPSPEPVQSSVRTLYCDRKNDLWIGTGNRGVIRSSGGAIAHYKKSEGLPDLFVSTIFEDSRGQLWVGTSGGLCRWSGDKFATEVNSEGISYESVYCIAEDVEGNIWVGTKEGLNQLWVRHFQAYTMPQGIGRNNVMSVCGDQRNDLWFATWGGGLGRLRNGTIVSYRSDNSPLHDVLLSTCQTQDGSLWIGADFDGGLFQFKGGKFTRFGKEDGITDSAIRVIFEDREGYLWFRTSGGLYRKRGNAFDRFTTADGLSGDTVRCLYEDREGQLWIGTNEGLSRRRAGTFENYSHLMPTMAVLAIHEDKEGSLWIGTDGNGLFWLRNKNADGSNVVQVVQRSTTKDRLFSNTIFEILEDDLGYLWMSCLSGVFRVAKDDLKNFGKNGGDLPSVSFGKSDGMYSAQCNGVAKPAAWKAKDGRLWFPTTHGVVVIDPRSVSQSSPAPPVAVRKVLADKQDTGLGSKSVVAVKPGHGELELHYSAFSFRSPEKNVFRYKLEGIDRDWVDAGGRRMAYYNHVPPGNYVFHVTAANHEGIWNRIGDKLEIRIQPHYWQTGWFRVLIGMSAVGLVAGSARYLTWKRVRERLLRLEQQHGIERERTRIAQDMHDDLGSRLTGVLLLSRPSNGNDGNRSDLGRLQKISEAVEEVIDNLHALVWAVNPQNDSLDNLVSYIQQHAQAFLKLGSIRCRFDLPDQVPHWQISSDLRHNLFMVIKEALNNIAKHANASEVWCRMELHGSDLRISIEDNGKGFDAGRVSLLGNGIGNMRKRMEKCGGTLTVTSQFKTGTVVSLTVPMR